MRAARAPAPKAAGPRCEVCRAAISKERLARSASRRGLYVCPSCRGPRAKIPDVVLGDCIDEDPSGALFEGRTTAGASVVVALGKVDWNDAARSRFAKAVSAVADLSGPGVVPILSHGAGQTPYFVIDGVWSDRLRARVEREGPLPVLTAVVMGEQLARGLAVLEERGITPREVTPDTIHVAAGDRAGLRLVSNARIFLETGPGEVQHGMPYMPELPFASPEAISDPQKADARSAVYSLGGCLYYALAGKKPFTAKSNMDFFMKILHEEPPPLAEHNLGVPPVLANLIAKCMRKAPDARCSARELATMLGYLRPEPGGRAET